MGVTKAGTITVFNWIMCSVIVSLICYNGSGSSAFKGQFHFITYSGPVTLLLASYGSLFYYSALIAACIFGNDDALRPRSLSFKITNVLVAFLLLASSISVINGFNNTGFRFGDIYVVAGSFGICATISHILAVVVSSLWGGAYGRRLIILSWKFDQQLLIQPALFIVLLRIKMGMIKI